MVLNINDGGNVMFWVLKVVIYYTAAWCGPCKFVEPYFKDFAAMYPDVQFIKIDVDQLPVTP